MRVPGTEVCRHHFLPSVVARSGDDEFNIWDSNAESVRANRRRSRLKLKTKPLLEGGQSQQQQQQQQEERSRKPERPPPSERSGPDWHWSSDDDAYEFDEFEDEEDMEDADLDMDWKAFVGIFGIGLPAALIGVPWLLTHPVALTMTLALLPLAQRALGFAIWVWDGISKALSSRRSRGYERRWRSSRPSRRRKRARRTSEFFESTSETDTEDESFMAENYYDSRSWSYADADADADAGADANAAAGERGATGGGGWAELEADRALLPLRRRGGGGRMRRFRARKKLPLFWRIVLSFFPFLRSWGGFV